MHEITIFLFLFRLYGADPEWAGGGGGSLGDPPNFIRREKMRANASHFSTRQLPGPPPPPHPKPHPHFRNPVSAPDLSYFSSWTLTTVDFLIKSPGRWCQRVVPSPLRQKVEKWVYLSSACSSAGAAILSRMSFSLDGSTPPGERSALAAKSCAFLMDNFFFVFLRSATYV